jgi:hypothetical protein
MNGYYPVFYVDFRVGVGVGFGAAVGTGVGVGVHVGIGAAVRLSRVNKPARFTKTALRTILTFRNAS